MKNKILIVLLFTIETIIYAQAPSISWQKTFGGTETEVAHSIIQTSDGGYIVAGIATSDNSGQLVGYTAGLDGWIIKLSSTGTIQWQKIIGGDDDDQIHSIQQTADGGYIIVGESNSDGLPSSNNDFDYWVAKLDSNGNVQWQNKYGGSSQDRAYSIKQTIDGGYVVAGQSASTNGDVTGNHGNFKSDFWIVKLNNTGTIQWQKSLGGTFQDEAYSIEQTTDGGYIVAGSTYSKNGDVIGAHDGLIDYWIVKLDSTGNLVWQKPLGGSGNDEAFSIQQTTDGGYIVAGNTNSINGDVVGNSTTQRNNYWIVKLDSTGNIQWQKCPMYIGTDIAHTVRQTSDGGYVIVGESYFDYPNCNIFTLKLNNIGNVEWSKTIGNPYGNTGTTDDEMGFSIQQTTDNGYIIAGFTSANTGLGNDFYVTKLNPSNLSTVDFINSNTKIYPNPTKNILRIDSGFENIEIYDTNGRNCTYKKINDNEISIDFLPKGIYLIKIFIDNTISIKKIIKE